MQTHRFRLAAAGLAAVLAMVASAQGALTATIGPVTFENADRVIPQVIDDASDLRDGNAFAGCGSLSFAISLDGSGEREVLDFVYENACSGPRLDTTLIEVRGRNLGQFADLDLSPELAEVLDPLPRTGPFEGTFDSVIPPPPGFFFPFLRVAEEFRFAFTDAGTDDPGFISIEISQIPLPASAWALAAGIGLIGAVGRGRRRAP